MELNEDLLDLNAIALACKDLWLEPSKSDPNCYAIKSNARGEIPRSTPPLNGDQTSADIESDDETGPQSSQNLCRLLNPNITLR